MLKKHHSRKSKLNIYGESVQGEDWFDSFKNRFTSSLPILTENLTFSRTEHFLFSYQAPTSPVNCFFFQSSRFER